MEYNNIYKRQNRVFELALRIAFLKQGVRCSDRKIEYAMNEVNDWIILRC